MQAEFCHASQTANGIFPARLSTSYLVLEKAATGRTKDLKA